MGQEFLLFVTEPSDPRNEVENQCDGRHELIGLDTTFREYMDPIDFSTHETVSDTQPQSSSE